MPDDGWERFATQLRIATTVPLEGEERELEDGLGTNLTVQARTRQDARARLEHLAQRRFERMLAFAG